VVIALMAVGAAGCGDASRAGGPPPMCSRPSPAQTTLARIHRSRLTTYVQLYKALGGGWNLTDAQWAGQSEATSGGDPR